MRTHLSTMFAAALTVGILAGGAIAQGNGGPTPTEVTIDPSGIVQVCDGDQVTITGTVTAADYPGNAGKMHIQLWDEIEQQFDTVEHGTPDENGQFSIVVDTTGLAGSELIFRAHFTNQGSGFATNSSDPMYLQIVSCAQGCGHGYWKNHPESWAAAGYAPTERLDDVFYGDFGGVDPGTSLMDALSFSGGPTVDDMRRLLLMQAVAAVLNAAHPDIAYPLEVADILLLVGEALDSGERELMEILKDELDEMNNLGCPLE